MAASPPARANRNKAADPSGATASVALVCGRVVTVAGVGDSYVVLDTGSQILRLSPDHRVDNSEAERQRCTVKTRMTCRHQPFSWGMFHWRRVHIPTRPLVIDFSMARC